MNTNLAQRDIKVIQQYDKDFNGELLTPDLFKEYPRHYRYILFIKSKLHSSGYPTLKVIGKGVDHKFYYIEEHDCIDFNKGIKIDNFGHITRVQANAGEEDVKGEMGIFLFYLHNIVDCCITRES